MNFKSISKEISRIQSENKSEEEFKRKVQITREALNPIYCNVFYFETNWDDWINMQTVIRTTETVVRCKLVHPNYSYKFSDEEVLKCNTNERHLHIDIDKPHIYNNKFDKKPQENKCPCCGEDIKFGGILECKNTQCVLGVFFSILYGSSTGLKENDLKTISYLEQAIGKYYKEYHPEWYEAWVDLNKSTRITNKINSIVQEEKEEKDARYERLQSCFEKWENGGKQAEESEFESYRAGNYYAEWTKDKSKYSRYISWRNKRMNAEAFKENHLFYLNENFN